MPGRWTCVGVELARLDELLDLGDRDPAGHGAQRVEVAGGLVEDEVAVPVALRRRAPGRSRSMMACSRTYVAVRPSTSKLAGLLGRATRPRRCRPASYRQGSPPSATWVPTPVAVKNAGMPDAAGAQPLGQRALRRQLDLELAGEVLPLELLVLADVGADHPADPLVAQQDAEAPVVDAAVVRDGLEVGDAGVVDAPAMSTLRDAAEPETADRQRRSRR